MKIECVKYMLFAQDMNRALAFYRDVLGLSVKLESEHWSELTHGDSIVALHGGHDGSHDDGEGHFDETAPFSEWVREVRDRHNGVGVPHGAVPSSFFLGFLGDEVVGRVSVRHSRRASSELRRARSRPLKRRTPSDGS